MTRFFVARIDLIMVFSLLAMVPIVGKCIGWSRTAGEQIGERKDTSE